MTIRHLILSILISFILTVYTPLTIAQWLLLSLFIGFFYFILKRPIQINDYGKLLALFLVISCLFNVYLGFKLFESYKAGKNGLIYQANSLQMQLQEIYKMLSVPDWDSKDHLNQLHTDLKQTVYIARSANQYSYVNSVNYSRLSTNIGELGYIMSTKYVNAVGCLTENEKNYCNLSREEYIEVLKILKNRLEKADFEDVLNIKNKENEQELKRFHSKVLIFLE
ncbi:MAG TPA: hypothetical protein GXX18_02540 [Bacillales bacterium]|nr:hypothetical protein [Bacillales bacterium]